MLVAARRRYLQSLSTSTRAALSVLGVDFTPGHDGNAAEGLLTELGVDWASSETHNALRVTSPQQFAFLFPDHPANEYLSKLVADGYQLSIMPLVFLDYRRTGTDRIIAKYVPPADFFAAKKTDDPDPYMIWDWDSIVTRHLDDGQLAYVGTHKFPESLLANITYHCPHGCSTCYKQEKTRRPSVPVKCRVQGREYTFSSSSVFDMVTGASREVLEPTEETALLQSQFIVDYLNRTPVVKDVILSGGEPLAVPNGVWRQILRELSEATHLRILRICTGAVFQGDPFRIDDELVDLLAEFGEETGIAVKFQTHLSHSLQFTPEACEAVLRIRRRGGFPINTQLPIQEGVNFWRDDEARTLEEFGRLGHLSSILSMNPYKYMLDMVPADNKHFVPVETLLSQLSPYLLSHKWSDQEKPTTLSVLSNEGNLILDGRALLAAKKLVYPDADTVLYLFDGVDHCGRRQTFHIVEPVVPQHNDDPESLDRLKAFSASAVEPSATAVEEFLRASAKPTRRAIMEYLRQKGVSGNVTYEGSDTCR